jgi:hypothetical protein
MLLVSPKPFTRPLHCAGADPPLSSQAGSETEDAEKSNKRGADCDAPSEFFKNFKEERVFIADDAFGSTEYEATRGTEWSRNLHKILPKLDSRHWLVWTSRMHILQKALNEMALQGKAAKFRKPGRGACKRKRAGPFSNVKPQSHLATPP